MKRCRHCDTPMKHAARLKPVPGEYKVMVSFPAADLHDHTDDKGCCPPGRKIPMRCKFACASERVAQFDMVGPKGHHRKSIDIPIADFVTMTDGLRQELVEEEAAFARQVGLPFANQIMQIHEAMYYPLAENLMVEELDPSQRPTPIAGVPRDEAIDAIERGDVEKYRGMRPDANPQNPRPK